ncbi:WNK protein kinase [Balamuthia mandrillaris]
MKLSVMKSWIRQVLSALHYLHNEIKFIHQDVRCANIFTTGGGGSGAKVKLGGLELSMLIERTHASEFEATPGYMAPERANAEWDEKVDIYAFGMCVLEMFTFELPYHECQNSLQILSRQMAGIKPPSLQKIKDPEVSAFIERCLEFDPHKRPTALELLNSSFLNVEGEASSASSSSSSSYSGSGSGSGSLPGSGYNSGVTSPLANSMVDLFAPVKLSSAGSASFGGTGNSFQYRSRASPPPSRSSSPPPPSASSASPSLASSSSGSSSASSRTPGSSLIRDQGKLYITPGNNNVNNNSHTSNMNAHVHQQGPSSSHSLKIYHGEYPQRHDAYNHQSLLMDTSEGTHDTSLKCYLPGQYIEGDSECIRLYLSDISSVTQLMEEILEAFGLQPSDLIKVKYKDEESDFVTITKKTQMRELYDHALSLHVYTRESEEQRLRPFLHLGMEERRRCPSNSSSSLKRGNKEAKGGGSGRRVRDRNRDREKEREREREDYGATEEEDGLEEGSSSASGTVSPRSRSGSRKEQPQ